MNERTELMLRSAMSAMAVVDLAWTRQARRGRWMVVESGPSRYLRDQPRWMREYIDARSERRGRRFSSLSRARAFARLVNGHVERRGRRQWRNSSLWERASHASGACVRAVLAGASHLEVVP